MKFLVFLCFVAAIFGALAPKKVLFYYGWPSTVAGTLAEDVDVFNDYDIVVFGDGLESSGHGDHANTEDIMNDSGMNSVLVCGYISLYTDGVTTGKSQIDDWASMGVDCIFIDEFGFDYSGNNRDDQNELVEYTHNASLRVFVNAWNPDHALSNSAITPGNTNAVAHKLNTDDIYLAESFAVLNNAYDDTDTDDDGEPDWYEKGKNIKDNYVDDIEIACVGTTGASEAGFTQAKADFSYYACAMFGFDYWGWGEKNYGSAGGSSSAPFRTRKAIPSGTSIYGTISEAGDTYKVCTNVGFNVDHVAHTTSDSL